MKKALLVALMGLMTIITANAAVDFQNITITLKDGQVIKYDASQLDHVTYVGGEFGEEGAVGIKLYTTATTSEDYLYSQIISIVYDTQESTTTTFTRITSTDQLEAGKRYIIVCEEQSGAMGGIYNTNYRSIVTSGITLNNGTATVENESDVSIFTLGGSTSSWTFNDGSYYLANNSSSQLNSITSATNNNAKWSIAFNGNNATITNKQNVSHKIFYNSGSNYSNFNASTSGTAVQLYVEDNGGSVIPTTVATPTFSPAGGPYSVAQTVTITTTTSGATIYYTTDGTTPTTSSTHYTAAITVSTTTTIKAIAVKDGVSSAVATATFTINSGSTTDNNVNANWHEALYNSADDHDDFTSSRATCGMAWRLEYPHISTDANSTVVVHATSQYKISLSMEIDKSQRANRWSCFTMHNGVPNKDVGRYGTWRSDPCLPSNAQVDTDEYSSGKYTTETTNLDGSRTVLFSRGHICASEDRQSLKEQNSHTFYTSNCHPQYQQHNGGIWGRIESKVQNWGYSSSFRDTLYVCKGATIADVKLDGQTVSGTIPYSEVKTKFDVTLTGTLVIPRYWYMAVLCYKNGTYHAMAFWSEQINSNCSSTSLASCAITIDELERRTGIDFFCNLPDDIEDAVEATYDSSFWNP